MLSASYTPSIFKDMIGSILGYFDWSATFKPSNLQQSFHPLTTQVCSLRFSVSKYIFLVCPASKIRLGEIFLVSFNFWLLSPVWQQQNVNNAEIFACEKFHIYGSMDFSIAEQMKTWGESVCKCKTSNFWNWPRKEEHYAQRLSK